MFRNFLFVFLLIVLLSSDVRAQYSQVGDGAFSSGNFGPIATDTLPAFYSRFAFIYPSITLTNLSHGDSIRALGFQFDAFDSLRGNCNMRIFLKSSVQADYGALPINWLAESRNGMTLVYDGSPKTIIGDKPGEAVFVFNQVAGWKMDTSGMATNLEVLIEYYQSTNQVERFNWKVENNVSVTGFISANEGKYVLGASTSGMDSVTTGSTIIKPSLTIYHPLGGDDLTCKKIYALGTVPLLMDRPDSIKVRVQNVGSTATSNKKVYLNVSGANTFEDTIYVDGLEAFQSQMIYFTNYEPSNIGTENLTVQIDDDDNNANNTLVKSRLANYNVYSHADPFSPNSGGIGFNGSTGDFLAKFYVEGSSYINQIKVDFNLNGRGFQLGVWDDDGPNGNPGTEIFISDSSLSTTGTFIMPVLPRIQVSGGFYAGIRQITNTNVAFSYQTESPVRPNTFILQLLREIALGCHFLQDMISISIYSRGCKWRTILPF